MTMSENNNEHTDYEHAHDHAHHADHRQNHMHSRRDRTTLYTPLAIMVAGIFIAGGLFLGLSHGPAGSAATGTQPAAPAVAVDITKVKTDGEPYIGQANAPVVMAFWSDFQCPYCKAYEVGGIPQITTPAAFPDLVKNYVATGKLKVIFKDFPFLGNDSITAGEYGRSIWKLYPDQYFAWRTAMYTAQDQEGDQGFGNAATIDKLITTSFAAINDATVKVDIAKNKSTYDAVMQADEAEGASFGIQGTPGFIIGKTLIAGAEPLANFTSVIDAQLKK
jgi:protein-disulfide isomerase